jgi:hypothetical protein
MDTAVAPVGTTGFGKTSGAVLAQQHFGAAWDLKNTPANWDSTANFINEMLFLTKDALCLIDDLRPSGPEGPQHARAATTVVRAIGNLDARGRMQPDTRVRMPHPPRTTALITAEDLPLGHSTVARLVVVEITKDDLPRDTALTAAQRSGSDGVFARAMSGYIRWIAEHYDELARDLPPRLTAIRDGIRAYAQKQGIACHDRAPSNLAQLQLGLEIFASRFAVDVGALDAADAARRFGVYRSVTRDLLREQAEAGHNADPVGRYLELLGSAIISGAAHLAAPDGTCPTPSTPGRYGWRKDERVDLSGTSYRLMPQGERVGYVDSQGDLRIVPATAHKVVVHQAAGGGSPFLTAPLRVQRMLHEHGLLQSTDGPHHAPKFRAEGGNPRCLHLAPEAVFP